MRDKNQLIGMGLIFLLIVIYLQFFAPDPPPPIDENIQDTLVVENNDTTQKDTTNLTDNQADTLKVTQNDSIPVEKNTKSDLGIFSKFEKGTSKDFVLENENLKVTLTSQGGRVKEVILKKYLDQDKKPIRLIGDDFNKMSLFNEIEKDKQIDFYQLFYQANFDKDNHTIAFRAEISKEKFIEQVYKLQPDSYELSYFFKTKGFDKTFKSKDFVLTWRDRMPNTEPDIANARYKSTVNYYTANEEFNYLGESSTDQEEENVKEALHWIGFKQKFFTSGIIAQNKNFKSGDLLQITDEADSTTVKIVSANLLIPTSDISNGKGQFTYYFGPNRYQILNEVTDGFYKNVDLGWPVINLITRFIVVPLFSFLEGFINNYGLIIIIMVIIIRLAIFPLTYKSHMSMGRMKALAPEMAEIKEKFPDDMAKQQQETMKLYQQVGVNPLSGCLPLLLQMPVLFAMFTFFPNAIELRQESFLWASDLSHYDDILKLPFNIPFTGYNHLSIFTLLMSVSTLATIYFNPQAAGPTPANSPINMKVIQYLMPVSFIFILNSFPSGLTFYYFVSNLFGISQQLVIRQFVDDKKIRAKLEAKKEKNKNNPKKKSKFQQRLEDAVKMQEERTNKLKTKRKSNTNSNGRLPKK